MARALRSRGLQASTVAPPSAPRASTAAGRIEAIDAARGIALCMMFVYHFAFDLRYFGALRADFENDPLWLGFRAVIVSSFLTIVGVSLTLAERSGMRLGRFLRRLGWIAAGAIATTAASLITFPQSFIYFGILHSIVVASLLAWPLRRYPIGALALGLAVLVAGSTLSHPAFDAKALSIFGFTTHKPITEDYVPLAPWSAAVFIGIAVGHGLARVGFRPLAPLGRLPGGLRWLGRHSLIVYLVHQPILLAVLWVVLGH